MANNYYMEKKYIEKYKINLIGEKQSIKNLIETYMNYIYDKRVVLAIDAASVPAPVSVSKDGTVKGLLSKKFTEDSEKILSSLYEFAKFVKKQ